ncbi:MAG: hypothetical protein ACXWLR_04775 [Myxococcales bacterium]
MRFLVAAACASLLAAPVLGQTVSLSPAVIQLRGEPGQSTTQTFTMVNATSIDLSFKLEAKDVLVRDGRRLFVEAGELPGSLAATAVFSPQEVVVGARQQRSVEITVTSPRSPKPRAILALWRGTTRLPQGSQSATVSLGALLTFAFSDQVSLAPGPLVVHPQSASANATFEQSMENDGSEPLVERGMAVILNGAGAIVGKALFEPRRLLPGERATVRTEYGGVLRPGRYRVLSTLEYEGRTHTRSAQMEIR